VDDDHTINIKSVFGERASHVEGAEGLVLHLKDDKEVAYKISIRETSRKSPEASLDSTEAFLFPFNSEETLH
jgi:hypothetical protein